MYTRPLISGDWQKYAANIIKQTQTGINRKKYTFCIMKSLELPKSFKSSHVPYLGLIFVNILEIYLMRQSL